VEYVACALSGSYQPAAIPSRRWANANSSCHGHVEVTATLIRRTLMRTKAPSFSSLSRIVPQDRAARMVVVARSLPAPQPRRWPGAVSAAWCARPMPALAV